jgi:hypothetical protein
MVARRSPEGCGAGGPPFADGTADCRCHQAVTRAYAEMVARGAPGSVALEAAIRVFVYHHPEVPAFRAHDTVETWVYTGPLN